MENGYRTQQATKPQTLSYAMMDSPVGIAAWILEKFNSWSDTVGDDVESAHTKDVLLKNGREQRIYFFAKQVKEGALDALPEGFMIKENTQTGLPVLKRAAAASA